MKRDLISIILLIFLIIFSLFLGVLVYRNGIKEVKAGTDENVSGWAWSENIGWISFNCYNDYNGDGVLESHCTDAGYPSNYGVNIDPSTGIFSGYAWSENMGWIAFADYNGDGVVNSNDNICPSSPCEARLYTQTGKVSGWAKVLSWENGWIRLKGTATDGSPYEVSVDNNPSSPSYQEFSGWAWGDTVTGWISFNCSNCVYIPACDGYPLCDDPAHPDYKVQTSFSFNRAPTATDLSVSGESYCDNPLEHFSWTFSDLDGDKQGAYQLQVDKEGDWIIGEGEFDSGKVYSESYDRRVLVTLSSALNKLDYNSDYYWRLKVWDEKDTPSVDWFYGPEFDTEDHIYPSPDFNWSPTSPSLEQIVQFCSTKEATGSISCLQDVSTCYDINNNKISCSGKTFLWTFLPLGTTEFATGSLPSSENPRVGFTTIGEKSVSLNITDDIGSCTSTKPIRVTPPLPKWKEVEP